MLSGNIEKSKILLGNGVKIYPQQQNIWHMTQ